MQSSFSSPVSLTLTAAETELLEKDRRDPN